MSRAIYFQNMDLFYILFMNSNKQTIINRYRHTSKNFKVF